MTDLEVFSYPFVSRRLVGVCSENIAAEQKRCKIATNNCGCHSGESRNPESFKKGNATGFRVKHGMTHFHMFSNSPLEKGIKGVVDILLTKILKVTKKQPPIPLY